MLLDTSGLFAVIDAREPQHDYACSIYLGATRRLTHAFVLAEVVALGNARGAPHELIRGYLLALLENPDIVVVWPDMQLTSQAIMLLGSRRDKGYSLCDAVSFVLMRKNGFRDALTTDVHFEQEGFVRLLV